MIFAEKYENLVRIATFLGVIGVPTIAAMTTACIVAINRFFKILNYLQAAVKSQIRADLIKDYELYVKAGELSQIELDEWMNRFEAYEHLVGNNSVLQDRSKKLLTLHIK